MIKRRKCLITGLCLLILGPLASAYIGILYVLIMLLTCDLSPDWGIPMVIAHGIIGAGWGSGLFIAIGLIVILVAVFTPRR